MLFDPEAPLPGPPDPWAPSTTPELRASPPYLMTEMIAAEPALADRVVRRMTAGTGRAAIRDLATTIRALIDRGDPIVTTGCGTSEHAAMAAALVLRDTLGTDGGWRVQHQQALDLLMRPLSRGLLLAISHEGGTWATNEALRAARTAGGRTALFTVSARSPGGALADHVIETGEQDRSWCHTVGYLSPIIAAGVLAGELQGKTPDPLALRHLLAAADQPSAAEAVAARLAGCDRLMVVGAGADHPPALELALKIEEGSGIPARALHLETLRHGHLAAADQQTGLVLFLTASEQSDAPVRERALAALRAAAALGVAAAAVLGPRADAEIPGSLTPAGRLSAPQPTVFPPIAASILGSAIPLQLLAERLARARGRDPDLIGRDEPRQATAAEF